ncbi:unnamed protein product, partial [marine sediment metagenome]
RPFETAEQPQITLEQIFQETVNLIRASYEEPGNDLREDYVRRAEI